MTASLSLDLDLGEEFDFDRFQDDERRDAEQKIVARATATRNRIETRRAKSEAVLAEILPGVIATGESWHVLSGGDVDSLSFLAHLLASRKMRFVAFSTWCMALEDVKRIEAWLQCGAIGRVDAYVGEIFPGQYADAHEHLCKVVRPAGGRVCVFRNHSKVFLCESADDAEHWVIESSANINTNPRAENTVITADAGLFHHHKAFFDAVRSFGRDFDAWTPFVAGGAQ